MFRKIEEYIPERMKAGSIGAVNEFSVKVAGQPTLKKPNSEELQQNTELLQLCEKYWTANDYVRRQYTINLAYKNGDQFCETVEDPDTTCGKKHITEREYIIKKGRTPRQNNIINSTVRTVVGQFLQNPPKTIVLSRSRDGQEGAEILTNAIQSVHDFNKYMNIRRQCLNAFLTSGFGCFATHYRYVEERNKQEVVYEMESLYRMFWNNDIKDSRFNELNLIGRLVDTTLENVVSQFAKNTADEKLIREWYAGYSKDSVNDYLGELFAEKNLDFFVGKNTGTVRVIEIWYKRLEWRLIVHDPLQPDDYASYPYSISLIQEIDSQNALRVQKAAQSGIPIEEVPFIRYEEKKEQIWHFKYLTPRGETLSSGETPYLHQGHPYTIFAYPMEEGIIRGFVSDLRDPQRSINRDLMLIDFIISASAKGVLLVPEEAIPEGMEKEDFADEWSKFDGVIAYKAKPGVPAPHQVSANSTNIGIFDILKIHLSMFQDQSGVSPALKGDKPTAGTPSSRYAQESFNSSLTLLDYMECFRDGLERNDEKILKMILQYYEDGRTIYNAGAKNNIFNTEEYRKSLISSVGYDVKIVEGNSTPIFRQMYDDFLMQLFAAQAIDVEMMLENSSLPFADKLLQQLKQRREAAQDMNPQQLQQQGLPQIDESIMQQIDQQIPPQNQAIINQLIGGRNGQQ